MNTNITISTNSDLISRLKELNPNRISIDKYHATAYWTLPNWDKDTESKIYGFLETLRAPFYYSRVDAKSQRLIEEWTYGRPIRYWRDYLDLHEILEAYHVGS